MRRIVIALMSTVSGLVLLFSYHTSTNSTAIGTVGTGGATGSGSTGSGSTGSGSTGSTGTGNGSTGTGSGTTSGSSTASGTFTGDPADTRWGIVQVRIVVQGGKIVSSDAVQVPNGNGRDVEINNYAVPILNQAAVSAQNANFDGISGATVTSDGYKQSLQSAIDQAHL